MPSQWSQFAAVPLALFLAACSHATHPAQEEGLLAPDGRRIINEQAIERSGARTAWEVLQRTVPFFAFHTNSRGRPTRVEHRGRSSIALRDQPLILVDGVELKDFAALGDMPASDVFDIEVLTGVDATTHYGTNATNGVILIRTKVGGQS
jgi:outer membrane cobalamin receptor